MENISLDNLPQKVPFSDNLVGTFDRLKEEQTEEAYSLIQEAAESGALGKDEVTSIEAFRKMVKKSIIFYVVTDANNHNKILLICNITPSPVSRSTVATYNGGYIVLDPSCRSMGAGKKALILGFQAAKKMGFDGCVARISMTNLHMNVSIKKLNSVMTGSLPNSMIHEKYGWTDDVIFKVDYDFIPGTFDKDKTVKYREHSNLNHSKFEVEFTAREHTFKDGSKVTLTLASDEEVKEVDRMILSAAKKGDGFSEDEFLENGALNRLFFPKFNTLIAKLKSGEIIAAVTFGPTSLRRSEEAIVVYGYMIVNEKYRGKGYGTEMMKLNKELAKNLKGFQGIMTDVYVCDTRSLKLCRDAGMTCTGSLPHCGFMKSFGMADTCMYYMKV